MTRERQVTVSKRPRAQGLLASILPTSVVAEECFDDPPGTYLFPSEEACLTRAVDRRRREFTTVRLCARLALAQLGVPAAPLLPGEHGAPGWPDGIIGSMTHCAGYRGAAVAPVAALHALGVDAEPALPLPGGVLDLVSSSAERDLLSAHASRYPQIPWDRLLFSAKESVYKSWFPLTHRWLGFEDAELEFDPAAQTFTATLLIENAPVDRFSGCWKVASALAITAIAVPRGHVPNRPVQLTGYPRSRPQNAPAS